MTTSNSISTSSQISGIDLAISTLSEFKKNAIAAYSNLPPHVQTYVQKVIPYFAGGALGALTKPIISSLSYTIIALSDNETPFWAKKIACALLLRDVGQYIIPNIIPNISLKTIVLIDVGFLLSRKLVNFAFNEIVKREKEKEKEEFRNTIKRWNEGEKVHKNNIPSEYYKWSENDQLQWDLGDDQITFFDRKDGIEIVYFNKKTKDKMTDKVVTKEKQKWINNHINCIPMRSKGYVRAKKECSIISNGITLSLLSLVDREELFWELSLNDDKKKYITSFDRKNVVASNECSEDSRFEIEKMKSYSYLAYCTYFKKKDLIFLFKHNFDIERIILAGSRFFKIDKLILKPSYIDNAYIAPHVKISSLKWIATIIILGPSTEGINKEKHAQMIIEGINDFGNHFFIKAHFGTDEKTKGYKVFMTPQNTEIIIHKEDIFKLISRIKYRREVITVAKDRMQKMIDKIREESLEFSKPFNSLGNGSGWFLAGKEAHNCISWILNKYKEFLYQEICNYDELNDSFWTKARRVLKPYHDPMDYVAKKDIVILEEKEREDLYSEI